MTLSFEHQPVRSSEELSKSDSHLRIVAARACLSSCWLTDAVGAASRITNEK